jgi:hypothetical protein
MRTLDVLRDADARCSPSRQITTAIAHRRAASTARQDHAIAQVGPKVDKDAGT